MEPCQRTITRRRTHDRAAVDRAAAYDDALAHDDRAAVGSGPANDGAFADHDLAEIGIGLVETGLGRGVDLAGGRTAGAGAGTGAGEAACAIAAPPRPAAARPPKRLITKERLSKSISIHKRSCEIGFVDPQPICAVECGHNAAVR